MDEIIHGPLWLRILAILFAVLFVCGSAIMLRGMAEFLGRSPLFS